MEEIESKQAIEKIELIMEQLQEIKQHLEGAAPKVEEEPEEYDAWFKKNSKLSEVEL